MARLEPDYRPSARRARSASRPPALLSHCSAQASISGRRFSRNKSGSGIGGFCLVPDSMSQRRLHHLAAFGGASHRPNRGMCCGTRVGPLPAPQRPANVAPRLPHRLHSSDGPLPIPLGPITAYPSSNRETPDRRVLYQWLHLQEHGPSGQRQRNAVHPACLHPITRYQLHILASRSISLHRAPRTSPTRAAVRMANRSARAAGPSRSVSARINAGVFLPSERGMVPDALHSPWRSQLTG